MMKRFVYAAILLLTHFTAQTQQLDPTKLKVVYQLEGMKNVPVQRNNPYKSVNDTTLTFDIYHPASGGDGKRGVVIFVNSAGILEIPKWQVYEDWARLTAMQDLIAVTYQSRFGKAYADTEDLLHHLRNHADELKIDVDRIGLWSCSANVSVAVPVSMSPKHSYIRSLVAYYGMPVVNDQLNIRQDLPTLIVRSGLDSYQLNQHIEAFVEHSLKADARIEFINLPDAQHAFDIVDDNDQSRRVIQRTLEFMKQHLAEVQPEPEMIFTNQILWNKILDGNKTEETLMEWEKAVQYHRSRPSSVSWWNQIINERNLNALGYRLLNDQRYEDAIKVLTANQKAFPDSPNAHDSLADAYEKINVKEQVINHARLALSKLEQAELQPGMKAAIKQSAEEKLKRWGALK